MGYLVQPSSHWGLSPFCAIYSLSNRDIPGFVQGIIISLAKRGFLFAFIALVFACSSVETLKLSYPRDKLEIAMEAVAKKLNVTYSDSLPIQLNFFDYHISEADTHLEVSTLVPGVFSNVHELVKYLLINEILKEKGLSPLPGQKNFIKKNLGLAQILPILNSGLALGYLYNGNILFNKDKYPAKQLPWILGALDIAGTGAMIGSVYYSSTVYTGDADSDPGPYWFLGGIVLSALCKYLSWSLVSPSFIAPELNSPISLHNRVLGIDPNWNLAYSLPEKLSGIILEKKETTKEQKANVIKQSDNILLPVALRLGPVFSGFINGFTKDAFLVSNNYVLEYIGFNPFTGYLLPRASSGLGFMVALDSNRRKAFSYSTGLDISWHKGMIDPELSAVLKRYYLDKPESEKDFDLFYLKGFTNLYYNVPINDFCELSLSAGISSRPLMISNSKVGSDEDYLLNSLILSNVWIPAVDIGAEMTFRLPWRDKLDAYIGIRQCVFNKLSHKSLLEDSYIFDTEGNERSAIDLNDLSVFAGIRFNFY